MTAATLAAFQPPELPTASPRQPRTINHERLTRRTAAILADRSDVEKAIENMPAAYLECRDRGHDWQWFDAIDYGRQFERQFKCHSCTSVKYQILDNFGDIIRGGINYSDGYLLSKIGRVGKDSKGAFRLATTRAHARRPAEDGT
ncbi:MAG: hypothetical protein ACOC9B_04970 [Chloroflexota bacterium]